MSGSTVAAEDAEFIAQVRTLECDALKRARRKYKSASWDGQAEVVLGILAPVVVAVATGLTTLSAGRVLTGAVSVAATVLTAAYAGWAPGGRASRNWTSHADFHLIAGKAGDLRSIDSKNLSLEKAAMKLDALRTELAMAIRSAGGGGRDRSEPGVAAAPATEVQ